MYTNDRKAPRMGKGKFSKQVLTKELWKAFKKEHPREYKDMTWENFVKRWDELAETIRYESVHNPLGVRLGAYTGELKFQYLPHKFKAPDLKGSEEIGEDINHLNISTKGKVFKLKWERRWAVKFNKMLQFFAFEPHRKTYSLIKDVNNDSVRTARNTLGGYSIWRQIK